MDAEVAKIYSKDEFSICKLVKNEKEICASFVIICTIQGFRHGDFEQIPGLGVGRHVSVAGKKYKKKV